MTQAGQQAGLFHGGPTRPAALMDSVSGSALRRTGGPYGVRVIDGRVGVEELAETAVTFDVVGVRLAVVRLLGNEISSVGGGIVVAVVSI